VVVVWLSREPVDTDGQDWSARGVVVPSDIIVTRPEHLTNGTASSARDTVPAAELYVSTSEIRLRAALAKRML